MNLQNQNIEEKLNEILQDVKDEILEDEQLILELMIPEFDALCQQDQFTYIQYINKHYSSFSFTKHEKFLMLKQNDEQEEAEQQEEIFQNENQEKFLNSIRSKDFKKILLQIQDENFCQQCNIPIFWSSQETINLISNNIDIFQKLLELLDLESYQQGYNYLNKIIVWFELLQQSSEKNEKERLLIEQMVGSSLMKQILQFLEYKDFLKQNDQIKYDLVMSAIKKTKYQQQDNQNLPQFEESYQILFFLQTKLMNRQNLDDYLRSIFQIGDQQIDYKLLKRQIIKLLAFSSINIEELYFSIVFYFLHQYNNQYNFEKDYHSLESNLTKLKGKEESQKKMLESSRKKGSKIIDQFYQFLFLQLIDFQGSNIQIQESFSQYMIHQSSIENKILKDFDFLNKNLNLQFKEQIKIFEVLRKIPLVKLRQFCQQETKLQVKILLFSLIQKENSNIMFKMVQECQNQNIYQCAQKMEQFKGNFKFEESIIILFLIIGFVYEYKIETMEILINLFYIENSFEKASLIESVQHIVDQPDVFCSNHAKLLNQFYNITNKDWVLLNQVMEEKKISLLLSKFRENYHSDQIKQNEFDMLERIQEQLSQFQAIIEKENENVNISKQENIQPGNCYIENYSQLMLGQEIVEQQNQIIEGHLQEQNQQNLLIDQEFEVPNGQDSQNVQEINKLNQILDDINQGFLDDEKQIIREISPFFKELNQNNQNYFKYYINQQFKDYSFIQYPLFLEKKQLQQVEDYKILFQKLKIEQNWKTLSAQFSNEQFCLQNDLPKIWCSKEYLKVFQNHEFILEKVLNLNDLCSMQNGYHYIEVTELLIILFNYIINQEQDGNAMFQIISSTLRIQKFQFQQYQKSLRDNDQQIYSMMVQDIQSYQLKEINEIDCSKYSQEFQIVIKICTSNWNLKSFETFMNELFQSNQKELGEEQLLLKIQEIVIQNKMIEEIYFSLVIFYYTQYCNIVNFSKEKKSLDEQLTKLKGDRDRQIKQIERTINKFDSQDEILIFLVNKIFYFKDFQFKTADSEEVYKTYQKQQIESEKQLQPFLNNDFLQILQDQTFLETVSKNIYNISLIRVRQLFIQDKQIDFAFLLFNYLKRHISEHEELLKFLLSQQERAFDKNIEFIQNSYERTKNKQLTVCILIFLNQLDSFLNSNSQIYIQFFKIENSFKKATLIKHLLQITDENKINLSQDILESFSSQIQDDWLIIYQILGKNRIQAVFKFFLESYIQQQQLTIVQKKLIFKSLQELKNFITQDECHNMWLSKCILILSEKDFNFLVNQIQNTLSKLEENLYSQLTQIIYLVLKQMNISDQEKMLDYLEDIFKNQNFDLIGIRQFVKKGIQLEKLYSYQMINYYYQYQYQEKLLEKAKQFYKEDSHSYKLLFEEKNYFQNFQINPIYFLNSETQKNYPQQCQISLEDFNISLLEMTEEEKQNIIDDWFQNMNNQDCFRKLIPFYFNVIKRKEHPKNLLSFLNKYQIQKQLKLNMKAMFQIFYNNSNDELKSMLLKLWCQNNPIPLLFSNPQIDQIESLKDVFQLNEKITFVFPECYPIINFSLSKKQSSFGKTQLINQIFYQADFFEVIDNCELNQNTIDIMFDFCFSGSRNLAVADVHGSLPIDILIKILPIFEIWIVQVDSEVELKENYDEIQKIRYELKLQSYEIPECCFVVRNCFNKQKQKEFEGILENENISIHKIIDLTQKGLDKQTINTEIEEFSCFIFQKVQKLKKSQLKNSEIFFNQLSRYYCKFHPQIRQLGQEIKLLQQLDQELDKFIQNPQGFYSEEAFPIRSFTWQIKNLKQEMYQLEYLKKQQQLEHIESTKFEINSLEGKISVAKPTYILELFQEIFQSDNFYILYLKFTEKLRKFNEIHIYKLKQINQQINEQLQENKKEKKIRFSSSICMSQNQHSKVVDQTKALTEKLQNNLRSIELRNIGIELFWREVIQIDQKGQRQKLKINPADLVAKMVKKGEPLEFLDGDQLFIDSQFLLDFLKYFQDEGKVLVLSILGPQSSGKSTILNKIFGCHFWTSVGRCTKGIYLQLLKITQKSCFDNQFDYVLILDSEGLQNPNQADPEFDKKIALFILAISDIIIMNVKGDIHSQFKNLVEMCIFTLGQMKSSISSNKQLTWCFNQNNDCQNFAPFLDQIQSMVNALNLQVNNIDEEGDNTSFDYNEVLDLKKENIKILGFASTELTWRVNTNLGIYEEWRQSIINETFSEEAYIFGLEMIKQYLKRMAKEQNFQFPSLKQFIQNIESTWESICRLPDLLEFTELLQYKQDQSMKARYEQIYQKEPFNYQIDIPKKIYDQVQVEKKKNLEFFKRIEYDETKFIKYEIEKLKNKLEQELQKYKQENQIQKKIYKKYIKILNESLQTNELNCQLILFDEVKTHEREYQQKKGFTQIEDLVGKIIQNVPELQRLKGNREAVEIEFDKVWNKIINEATQQQEKVFKDFADAQYKAIQSSFVQYQYNSTFQEQFYNFIFKMSKNPPKHNLEDEQSQIFKEFMNEIYSQKQFQVVLNQNVKYNDIFNQPILERLKKSSKNQIIDLNDFFHFKAIVYYVDVINFYNYIYGEPFYDDFCQFKERKKNINNSYNRETLVNQIFSNFFNLLVLLQISFDQKKYHQLKDQFYYQINQKDLKKIFSDLQSSFSFSEQTTQIVRNIQFTKNLKINYPQLNLKQKDINVNNIEELDEQFQKLNGQIQFLYSQEISPKELTNDILKYIQDQKQNQHLSKQFNEKSASEFNKIITNYNGWNKIYCKIYEIIKRKMSQVKQVKYQQTSAIIKLESDSENEDILVSDNYLIKQIMSLIEQKILEFNKQFANFGVIFSLIGERCIYYYSIFIIWRFSCYSKWKQLEENHQKLSNMREQQLKKFIAEIEQNKTEQSILNAQILVKNMKQGFLEKFYQDQLSKVHQSIESMNSSSSKIVKNLDDRLLLNYERANQANIRDEDILSYILDQKSYIEKYTEEQIQRKENEIKNEYQEILRRDLKSFLRQIQQNISKIKAITCLWSCVQKSEEYFQVNDDDCNDFDYDHQLFLMISQCIQGQQINNDSIQKNKNSIQRII